jgi:uracil-DNA glycosylase
VQSFDSLITSVRACTLCTEELENGVRPVLQAQPGARILIAGQAPGSKVHATGIPFDDPSGDRLRHWMGIDRETFYDDTRVCILPMGFCYPGKGKSGDLPPVPRCAKTWRQPLLDLMPNIQLTLVIGQYAQEWHLEERAKTLTETVKRWESCDQSLIPLPHPSPRNNIWLKKNAGFEKQLVPIVASRVKAALHR